MAYFLAWKGNRGCRGRTPQRGRERRLALHRSSQSLPSPSLSTRAVPTAPQHLEALGHSTGKQHAPGARHSPLPPPHPLTCRAQGGARPPSVLSSQRASAQTGATGGKGLHLPTATPGLGSPLSAHPACSASAPKHCSSSLPLLPKCPQFTSGSACTLKAPLGFLSVLSKSGRDSGCAGTEALPRQSSPPHLCLFPRTHTQPPLGHLLSVAVFGSCQGMAGSNPGI